LQALKGAALRAGRGSWQNGHRVQMLVVLCTKIGVIL
jgi:hypothetical protein